MTTGMYWAAGLSATLEDPWMDHLLIDLRNHIDGGWPDIGDTPDIIRMVGACADVQPLPYYGRHNDD